LGDVKDQEEEGINKKAIDILKNKPLISVRFVTQEFVLTMDQYFSPAVVTWLKLQVNFSVKVEAQDDGRRVV